MMNARRLAKIAATLASHSDRIIDSPLVRERFDAETYWQACEQRLRRWNQALSLFKSDLEERDGHRPWPALAIIVEEIFYSEILTRVWTAAFSISQRSMFDHDKDAIIRAVWIGQLATRNQALQLIYLGLDDNNPEAKHLDALRRKLERWCDILLSRFAHLGDLDQFAFDGKRVVEWANDHSEASPEQQQHAWELLKESLYKALDDTPSHPAANPDLNRQVALTISSSLPQSSDVQVTEAESPWLNRLTTKASEMQQLIDEYIANAG